MYFSLKFLKKLNFGKKTAILLYKRSQNIQSRVLRNVKIFIDRGLYPTPYIRRKLVKTVKTKYGMFSFTRKPFAIPDKKNSRKR